MSSCQRPTEEPTLGLVSRNGIIPISISQDTAGPMARSVADAALLLNALAGVDDNDPAGHAAAGNIPEDYRAFLKNDALKGKRIGVSAIGASSVTPIS